MKNHQDAAVLESRSPSSGPGATAAGDVHSAAPVAGSSPAVLTSVTFDITDPRVHDYCLACLIPPDLLRGEGVSIGVDGPVPWGLEPDREIWGYIVSYDSAARRLEVAPKR